MPGTVTVRPLSAKLKRDTEVFGTMDPYCKITLGKQKVQSQVCKNGGKHPSWDDTLTLRRDNESAIQIELKEKDWLLPDAIIGYCDINLYEVEAARRVLKWYNVYHLSQPIGQILVEATYEPDQPKVQRDAPAFLLDSVPMEKSRQGQSVQSGQPASEKKGLLSGFIHGWNPFKGSSQPLQEKDVNKGQIQIPPPQQIQSQKVYESYPANGQLVPTQQQIRSEHLEQQQSVYAPPISEIHTSQEYTQKYPQFDTQEYPSTYNHGGYYYNPPNEENRQDVEYQGNQGSNLYVEESQEIQHNKNFGRYDPLSVIRGAR